ncbi:hypothetical protein HK097_011054 [Rhizophlyctis rosea]|uniref:Ribose 5-phosphate isomerase B n=1 Tax=Rhizophlyctis rosea TaxID=64517 RepID=A0AAD5SIL3_9FUNG|nr:hypothetical protein HK097_011054 [Rhizophlyctis rosea]
MTAIPQPSTIRSSESTKKLLVLGSDHVGAVMKRELSDFLKGPAGDGWDILDVGASANGGWHFGKLIVQLVTQVDYPDYGAAAANAVLDQSGTYEQRLGIVICGSGIGISIAANKIKGIRCALCHDHYTALMARKHNDANILALGARTTGLDVAKDMVSVFLSTPFDGAHHSIRLNKLHELEGCSYAC